ELESVRELAGKRLIGVGVLRPDVVLYNETHPQGDWIGALSEYDLKRRPDCLIVIGTSLRIPGVKRLIREMSKAVHSSSQATKRNGCGVTIFVNMTCPTPISEWGRLFDYHILGYSDQMVELLNHPLDPSISSDVSNSSLVSAAGHGRSRRNNNNNNNNNKTRQTTLVQVAGVPAVDDVPGEVDNKSDESKASPKRKWPTKASKANAAPKPKQTPLKKAFKTIKCQPSRGKPKTSSPSLDLDMDSSYVGSSNEMAKKGTTATTAANTAAIAKLVDTSQL
ncbi:NAD-dependent deacetylase hst3, partial [Spiromyces aspiralis]